MALVLKDRVKETTTTTGTGTITLAGAVSGFQSFSSIGNGNTTYYTIAGGTEWEVGLGTYTSSSNTLSRDTVLSSSNGGSLVNFSAGTKDVFVTYPADKAIYDDASGNVGIGTSSPTQPLTIYNSTNTTGTINVIGDGNASVITQTRYSNDTSPPQFAMQKAAGTFASPTVVTDGWQAGQWTARAFAGTNFRTITNILSYVDTVVSDTNISGILAFNTNIGGTATAERMRITSAGNVGIGTSSPTQRLTVNGAVGYNAPITVTDATHTVATTTNWIIANRAGTVTLTLPAAASFTGRILTVKNVQAQTVISASSNVVPIDSTSAGTAILSATAGKFATIVSDGTNWIVMQAN